MKLQSRRKFSNPHPVDLFLYALGHDLAFSHRLSTPFSNGLSYVLWEFLLPLRLALPRVTKLSVVAMLKIRRVYRMQSKDIDKMHCLARFSICTCIRTS